MKLTSISQQVPRPALPWHAYPDDTEALTRVYGQALILAYDYPVYTISSDGILIQDPDHGDARYEPYQTQFNVLCDKLLSLATEHGLETPDNTVSVAKFRKALLCGYNGESESKYAQQEKQTFEEIKYNFEVILNHIIKHTDIETLKDVLVTVSLCEGGVYADFKRLKEGLTEADGLLEFLQQQRAGIAESLAQKHIVASEIDGHPIDELYHTHLSIFFGNILCLMGETLPPMTIKDKYIPRIMVDSENKDNIVFINYHEAKIAQDKFNINQNAMMKLGDDFKKLNTAANMNQALAQHLFDRVVSLYSAYTDKKSELENKLKAGVSVSQVSMEAPGIALRYGIQLIFKKMKIEHLTTDVILHYDEYDFVKPMFLKSQKELRYYFYAAACFALLYQGMSVDRAYNSLPDNYELSIDASRYWVSLLEGQHNFIQALEAIPAAIVRQIIKLDYIDVHLVRMLRDAHRGNKLLHKQISKILRKIKEAHNVAQLQDHGHDFVIESNVDLQYLKEPINMLDHEALLNLLNRLVGNNRGDVLPVLPMEDFTRKEIYVAVCSALKSGYNDIAIVLISYYKSDDYLSMACTLNIALACDRSPIARMLLQREDCKYFIDEHIGKFEVTPLIYAVQRGKIEAVEMLLSSGANVDLKDGYYRDAFDYTRDCRILTLLVKYSPDLDVLSCRARQMFGLYANFDQALVRAYISRGGRIVLDEYSKAPHLLLDDPSKLLVYQLIDNPENLRPIERKLLLDYIIDDFNLNHVNKAITPDFLKRLVFMNLPNTTTAFHRADELLAVLQANQIVMSRKVLFSHPNLYAMSTFFGFSRLCTLAGIELGSGSALKLYAKVQMLRLTAEGKTDPFVMSAFDDVIASKDRRVAQALSRALNLIRPMYTRIFVFSSYVPSDIPVEMANRLRV